MIYQLKLSPIDEHFGLLELETQAGTYIKEFVHGDLGRTTPNIIELLHCKADILSLDVTGVLLDFPKQIRDEPLRPVTFDLPPFITLNEQQQEKCNQIISESIHLMNNNNNVDEVKQEMKEIIEEKKDE